ncbi:CaiB/BaiF CoA-transferase family protein [Sphingomonas oligophenolica]|uniref:CaiB/BaiF CoA-transferase family protein n=1 Tax=Sphingomonas oligophenolica TaxID=301154 RepID=A0ABU9Y671_9SPHN
MHSDTPASGGARGPLAGVRIIEIAALGPAPFAGMMLADHGADVIRIDRLTLGPLTIDPQHDILNRSRRSLALDLKSSAAVDLVRRLCASADGLIEGYRPGVMERLGLGPEILLAANPRLVYGRMTGWGQDGPYATTAGHDINYIALSGALHAVGRAGEQPTPPLNLVGDFGGGGMMLAFGMLAALLAASRTGQGQVVDCAMVDGSAVLMAMIYSLRANGLWADKRGVNLLDSGAPFYDTYETADGHFVSVGAIEPQFFAELLQRAGIPDDVARLQQNDPASWPRLRAALKDRIKARTRAEWCEILEGTDSCFAPVLSLSEAPHHPHNRHRQNFLTVDGMIQPAPAPRYSGTPTAVPQSMTSGSDVSEAVLLELGVSTAEIANLRASGVLR